MKQRVIVDIHHIGFYYYIIIFTLSVYNTIIIKQYTRSVPLYICNIIMNLILNMCDE